ncbi:MAG: hypothetical protein UU13_C0016G0009 [Candidatus Nomurabacteria bacterium GW2011_GWB1_40_7]|uniref:PrgI family protein n=1 Tax=Candidatus Nomurabacteria bacterium GW2011_GWB1_40_7 TaxID=1618744 RepID=A0A0G0T5L7_9BACT|nr:MAG: hypothetical protein UU13_C0016G0009 [Candidatus Nomurabacteria bacterium GW2011_GWB1_40_7]
MQFKVPQFLEIEDKIFGPFTFREFVYLAGGAGLCFTLYKLLGFLWGAIPILIVAGFSLLLTFYRPNNKPFINAVESGFKYFAQSKLYIWKKAGKKKNIKEQPALSEISKTGMAPQKLTESKLRDLAWSLDVLDLSKEKQSR